MYTGWIRSLLAMCIQVIICLFPRWSGWTIALFKVNNNSPFHVHQVNNRYICIVNLANKCIVWIDVLSCIIPLTLSQCIVHLGSGMVIVLYIWDQGHSLYYAFAFRDAHCIVHFGLRNVHLNSRMFIALCILGAGTFITLYIWDHGCLLLSALEI